MNLKCWNTEKRATEGPITFAVDDVGPAPTPLPTQNLWTAAEYRVRRKFLAVAHPALPVIQSTSMRHAFLAAVDTAFREHRPLSLSPDSIWMFIAQGFSHHILENAESLRGRLVRHQKFQAIHAFRCLKRRRSY